MFRKNFFAVLLALAAVGILLGECGLFHFPLITAGDVYLLSLYILAPGLIVTRSLSKSLELEWAPVEILSLSGAIGFGMVPIIIAVLHSFGFQKFGYLILLFVIIFTGNLIGDAGRKKFFFGWLPTWKSFFFFFIGSLLLFAAYNLQQFHYGADGSIVTHGLFGIDLPFLAGEIHGIRDFGELRDLHQSAQFWHYHDWTYQLLSLFPRERTLPDLAFAAPLVGYILLACSVFALVLRLSASRYIAYGSVGLWFLVSGIQGGELGSYALSPSFVFGTVIFVNLLLVFDLRMKSNGRRAQWIYSGIFFLLLFELSQTKLSTYLAILTATMMLSIMGLIVSRNKIRVILELLAASILSFVIVLLQNLGPNRLMPSSDFLIGAPLLGYANHVASILHIPISTVNPVSHGLNLRWQSLFIVPLFVFHFLRFALIDPKILSALIALVVFRKQLWNGSHELMWILVLLLPIGFLLPILYSPAWYPLALSFYAPLVSSQSALVIVAVAFGILVKDMRENRTPKELRTVRIALGSIALLFLLGISLTLHDIFQSDSSKNSVVGASLVHTMNYLQAHAIDTATIATERVDLDSAGDESYYWYSALSGRAVISEGAKYGSLLGAVADTNAVKGLHPVSASRELLLRRRTMLDTIFHSQSILSIEAALVVLKVSYILESPADSEKMLSPASYADSVFSEDGYSLWKVQNSRLIY